MITDFPPRPDEMTPAERRQFELWSRLLAVGCVASVLWLAALGVLSI